ncbi:MAG: RNA methyltransferase [Alphaproteobacteria bacterium]
MAGTDRSHDEVGALGSAPVVVLVEPQLGENIGAVARAMLNFGLTELRLVRPRDGWPNDAAVANASGADSVLDGATLHDSVADAVGDLSTVLAATARPRGLVTEVVTPGAAAMRLRAAISSGERAGVLFGRESAGLDNDAIALADGILTVPCNPGFSSINLGMAVLLLGYEWFRGADETPAEILKDDRSSPATKAELLGFFEQLESELDACGFLRLPDKRPSMVRNLRSLFQRARLTAQEVRTLRGVISGLVDHGRR